jgi:phosphoglycolate phosphatase
MRLALFDVDGTLILTGGAGMRAFYRALATSFNLRVDEEVIRPDGKTDPLIAREFLAHFGLESRLDKETSRVLFDAYLDFLDEEMKLAVTRGAVMVLPGVNDLLDTLMSRSDFSVGLVTGNLERGARIKLSYVSLNHYFPFGGYGSDAENRTELIRIGMARGTQWIAPAPMEGAYVIGDTPLDIIHGRAAGAKVIAVASSRYTMADLQKHDPDLLLPDLASIPKIMAFLTA